MLRPGCCVSADRFYDAPMRLSSFNYIQLLRYAGLFTYACVGIPLLWDSFRSPEEAGDPVDRACWLSAYLIFGVAYWIVTISARSLTAPQNSVLARDEHRGYRD